MRLSNKAKMKRQRDKLQIAGSDTTRRWSQVPYVVEVLYPKLSAAVKDSF